MLAYTILGVVLSGFLHTTTAKNQRHVSSPASARNLEKKCPNWKQMGRTFMGAEKEDMPGGAVALSTDGEVVAYGTHDDDDGAGSVSIYEWKNCKWKRRGDTVISGGASHNLGSAVSISGDGSVVAIGARKANDDKGYVTVYKFVENKKKGEWMRCGIVRGKKQYDGLGAKNTVSLSHAGERVAFGGDGRTTVQVYKVKVDGGTCDIKPLDVPSTRNIAGKRSVAISGDGTTVAVGTVNGPINHDKEGAGIVEVFKYQKKVWEKIGETIYGDTKYDRSGEAVSLSLDGSVLAIGASLHGNAVAGNVRVYKKTNADMDWIQLGDDIDGANANDSSGSSLSISDDGKSVVIGSKLNDGSGNQAGHVRVYKYDKKWSQIGEDIEGKGPCARLGHSVSISGDGGKVAIGAPGEACDKDGKPKGYVNVLKVKSCKSDSKILRSKSAKCNSKSPKSTKTHSPTAYSQYY